MRVLERLRGGLIVSVQAEADSVLNTPETIALLARCAEQNGAAGVRAEGETRLRAVRSAVRGPIVGLVKRRHTGFEPYITTTLDEIEAVVASGCELVAFDATERPRAGGLDVPGLVRALHVRSRLAMADCATLADMEAAAAAGADVVATTLAGYTKATRGRTLPALDLIEAFAPRHPFVVCEGGIASPDDVRRAFAFGAAAVVAGTALTNVDVLIRRFASAAPRGA